MHTGLRLLLAIALVGCGEGGPDDADNGPAGGKADDNNDAGEQAVDGDDPIADWLRHGAQWNEDGTWAIAPDVCFKDTDEGARYAPGTCEDLAANNWEGADEFMGGTTIKSTGLPYLDMLRQMSFAEGCDDDEIDSYIISDKLVAEGEESFPRVVNTLCSKDTKRRQNAYFALSFATEDGEDISTTSLEMFAWDDEEERYRFYKSEGEVGKRQLEVEAEECEGCHLTPGNLDGVGMAMTPIMNELERPWQHWHSLVNFDFSLPAHLDFTSNDSESFKAEMAERAPRVRYAGNTVVQDRGGVGVRSSSRPASSRRRSSPATTAWAGHASRRCVTRRPTSARRWASFGPCSATSRSTTCRRTLSRWFVPRSCPRRSRTG